LINRRQQILTIGWRLCQLRLGDSLHSDFTKSSAWQDRKKNNSTRTLRSTTPSKSSVEKGHFIHQALKPGYLRSALLIKSRHTNQTFHHFIKSPPFSCNQIFSEATRAFYIYHRSLIYACMRPILCCETPAPKG
jgi:hypothetical protein